MTIDTQRLRELAQKSEMTAENRDDYPANYARFIAAANPATVLELLNKLDGTESMFLAACADLGAVNATLDLDPDDGGAEPIIYEVKRLLTIEAAARNLQKAKGRHNSEIAMNQLLESLK